MSDDIYTKPITDINLMKRIYDTRMTHDFAPDELRPWSMILEPWQRGNYRCFGLFDGEELLAYAYFARLGESWLFDYLAVEKERRGQGLGTVFLRQLTEIFSTAECVILESEDPEGAKNPRDKDIRLRRLDFYRHAGLRETGVKAQVFGVDYLLFELPVNRPHTEDEIRSEYAALYRSFLPEDFYNKWIRI